MSNLNKIFTLILISIFSISLTFADANKDELLNKIEVTTKDFSSLKTNLIKELEENVKDLTNDFDKVFDELGYEEEVIDYLVSLGKINSNFKNDLVKDLTSLKSEISNEISGEIDDLETLSDNINYKYSTITNSQKETFLNEVNDIGGNISNIKETYESRIETLDKKYNSSLDTYKNSLEKAFNENKDKIEEIDDFNNEYQDLYSLEQEFNKNYEIFTNTFLSYAGDLKTFSEDKQEYYVNTLKEELEKLKDKNIEANKSLKNYEGDIDRFIEILLENFKNSLSLKISNNYGFIFSDSSDVDSLQARFEKLKNKYYDTNGNIKGENFTSSTGALEEVEYLSKQFDKINDSILNLIGEEDEETISLNNIKVRLENEMVRFYNDNYDDYRQDLLSKLKEKLDLNVLETKNALLAADSIDLRYSLVSDKITKSSDLKYIKEQIDGFKDDIEKYSLLGNETLVNKVKKSGNNLDIFYITKELSNYKYNPYSKLGTSYETQISSILKKLKDYYPEEYEEKLNKIVKKIDTILDANISTKNRYILLVIKRSIINFINDQI